MLVLTEWMLILCVVLIIGGLSCFGYKDY